MRLLTPIQLPIVSRLLFVGLLVCPPVACADSIVMSDGRDTVMRVAAPDTATLAGSARDSTIRWQFDTHG